MNLLIKKIFLCALFFILGPVIIIFSGLFIDLPHRSTVLGDKTELPEISILSALPEESGRISAILQSENAIPLIINNYLKKYNSPLLDFSNEIYEKGLKYGIKPQLLVAIAQQESNLGKTSLDNCYNAWGWGIHKNSTTCFSDWREGIDIVARGLSKNYCQKGLCDDPCEMMKKYTPSSNGSWCRGVNQFLLEMETGNF